MLGVQVGHAVGAVLSSILLLLVTEVTNISNIPQLHKYPFTTELFKLFGDQCEALLDAAEERYRRRAPTRSICREEATSRIYTQLTRCCMTRKSSPLCVIEGVAVAFPLHCHLCSTSSRCDIFSMQVVAVCGVWKSYLESSRPQLRSRPIPPQVVTRIAVCVICASIIHQLYTDVLRYGQWYPSCGLGVGFREFGFNWRV